MAIEEQEFQLDNSFLDPAVQDDPFESYATLREQCPVYRVPETGLYMVTPMKMLERPSLTLKLSQADRELELAEQMKPPKRMLLFSQSEGG